MSYRRQNCSKWRVPALYVRRVEGAMPSACRWCSCRVNPYEGNVALMHHAPPPLSGQCRINGPSVAAVCLLRLLLRARQPPTFFSLSAFWHHRFLSKNLWLLVELGLACRLTRTSSWTTLTASRTSRIATTTLRGTLTRTTVPLLTVVATAQTSLL